MADEKRVCLYKSALSGKQSCFAVTFDQAVVDGYVSPTPRHQLSTHDCRVDSTRSPLRLLGTNHFGGEQRLLQSRKVDVGKSLNFRLHCFRQVIELRGHKAAKADAIVVLQCPAKGLRIAAQCVQRLR
jgi:hypothetical protein